MLYRRILTCIACAVGACSAGAADQMVGPVSIAGLIQIALPTGGHSAGNLEISTVPAFAASGVACSGPFITTSRQVDQDKRIFGMLLTAFAMKQQVFIMVTDDPAGTAFPGRCSIRYVVMQ